MLHLHQSNRVECLADRLASVLRDAPPADPFAADTVMVQSAGMGRWLQLALASRLGVCAQVEFPFPAAFVWQLLREVLGDLPAHSPFDPPVLLWRLLALLDDLPGDEAHAPLRAWLATADERGRYDLAARLATTFDRYLVYRPDWIDAWEAGRVLPAAPHAAWQAALWRRLTREQGPHWVQVRERFAAAARAGEVTRCVRDGRLPARVALFGVPSVSPGFLDVLGLYAMTADVHVFFANPCREYWGDLRSEADRARLAERDPAEAMFIEVGHPLLASLGRQGADLMDLLLERDAHVHDAFAEPGQATWLAVLQGDILELHDRGGGGGQPAPLPVSATDASIEVHACHSPLREVEVLLDRLRDLFECEPDLDPSDVVVMVPDVERYAPAVEAVFGSQPAARRIDFRIADRGLAGESPLAASFIALLESAGGRHDAASVLALLDSQPLRRRFELDESAVESVHGWVGEARVRWGMDAEARAGLGLPAEAAHSWRAGLDRLLLGVALPGDQGRLFEGVLPTTGVVGGEARVLGRFASFLDALFELPARLGVSRPPQAWCRLLNRLLERFFAADEDDEIDAQRLRDAIDDIARVSESAGFTADVALPVVMAALRERTAGGGGGHNFLAGGVTFCNLTPMRGIPFEVVCLLGMDDGAFPRQERAVDFDLAASRFRRGDRSRRADDRYLFLELLLGARRRLYISHVGQDIRDNSVRPPSVLVAELLDCIDRSFELEPAARETLAASGIKRPRDLVCIRHPLQSFSRRYFDGSDSRLWSYDGELRDALARDGTQAVAPLLREPLPPPGEEWHDIDLDTLVQFFINPARFLLQRRLRVRLQEADAAPEDSEPFNPGGLERWQLRQALLTATLQGAATNPLRLAGAAGLLPHGRVGEVCGAQELVVTRRFATSLQGLIDEAPLAEPPSLDMEAHGVRLRAVLTAVRADGGFDWRFGGLRGRDAVAGWVRHLALCAAAPQGVQMRTRLLAEPGGHVFEALPVERARAVLCDLLGLYAQGLREPLPFFPDSAWASLQPGKIEPLERARRKWRSSEYPGNPPGEEEDAWFSLAFRDRDPLDERFVAIVEQVLGAVPECGA